MRVTAAILSIALASCAGTESFTRSATVDQQISACTDLDAARRTWEAISAGLTVVSGAGGVVAALEGDEVPRIAVGLTSAGIAAMAAVADYLSNDYAETYAAHGCTTLRE